METKKYVKKPVKVEATQFDGTVESAQFIRDWARQYKVQITYPQGGVFQDMKLYVPTLEGTMIAGIGDWIVKGVQDEFYPVKPDIFEETYQQYEELES